MKLSEEIENIYLADGCIDEGTLYAAGLGSRNILVEYQIEDQKLKRLAYLDGFVFSQSSQITATYSYGSSIFCFSLNSYEVMEYDSDTKKNHYYHPQDLNWKNNMIHATCRVKDDVWLFQETINPSIMVFSMKERQYYSYQIPIEGQTDMDAVIQVSMETCVCKGAKIWRCIPGTSDLLVLDTETKNAEIIKTGLQMSVYTLSYENDCLYLLSCDGLSVAVFHIDTHKTMVYQTGYTQTGVHFPFRQAIKTDRYLLLIPCYEKQIFCYEINGNQLNLAQKLHFPKEFSRIHGPEQRSLFCRWGKWNRGLFFFPFAGSGMLRLDLDTYAITHYPIRISLMDYLAMQTHEQVCLSEPIVGLENYLRYICLEADGGDEKEKGKTIGKNIWSVI